MRILIYARKESEVAIVEKSSGVLDHFQGGGDLILQGNILHCMKRNGIKPEIHQWRLLIHTIIRQVVIRRAGGINFWLGGQV